MTNAAEMIGIFDEVGRLRGFRNRDRDVSEFIVQPQRRYCGVFGDSTVANGLPAPGGNVNAYSSTRNAVRHANRKLGLPLRIVVEQGYSGKRTEEIFALVRAQPGLCDGLGRVFWSTGINNFSAGQTGAQVFNFVRQVHDFFKSRNIEFWYWPSGYQTNNGNFAALLAMCRQLADEDASFRYVDAVSPMLDWNQDPAALAQGRVLANYIAADGTGVHYAARAAVAIGDELARELQRGGVRRLRTVGPYGADGAADGDATTGLFQNGLVGATGAGWAAAAAQRDTGGAAAWAAVTSVVNMGTTGLQAELPGRLFQTVWTPQGGALDTDKLTHSVYRDIGAGFSVRGGKTYRARMYGKASSAGGGVHQLALVVIGYGWSNYAGVFTASDNVCFDPTSGPALLVHSMAQSVYEGVFETEFTVPAGLDQVHLMIQMEVLASPAAGAVTLQTGAGAAPEVFAL